MLGLALGAVVAAAERVETASLDGAPVVIRVDDTVAALGVRRQAPGPLERDWVGATVLSAGMRRWWTVRAVADKATRDLVGRDVPGWTERLLERCPDDSPAHLWLATAASLGGTNLDRFSDAERASQEAARFRQQRAAQPRGLYGLDELRPLAALDAWLARPMPPEVKAALEPLLTGATRDELERMRQVSQELFGRGHPDALLPRGDGDPLVALLERVLEAPPEDAATGSGAVIVRPQEQLEPCPACTHLGPGAEVDWSREAAFSGMPLLLVPIDYDDRNRPVLKGFIGVQTRQAEIYYTRPPRVRDADGATIQAGLDVQSVVLLEPRPVEVVLERAPTQAELATRFATTLDPSVALADLRPPPPRGGCGCTTEMRSPPWWTRVRRRASKE